jgi:hypothetical protein
MSVSKALRTQPFFFTMELTGTGLYLEEKSVNVSKLSLIEKEEIKEKKVKKLPDPISESIQERKDYGSYLSVVKNANNKLPEELFKFESKGIPEKELSKPVGEFPEPVTKLSMSFVETPGRRSLVDRKKSKASV